MCVCVCVCVCELITKEDTLVFKIDTPFVSIFLLCWKSQTFLVNIIYYLVYLIKMYKFTKLPLNKFISFFF